MLPQRFASLITFFALVVACGSGAYTGSGVRITERGDTSEVRAEVRDSGALMLDGRQIASVNPEGRVTTTLGELLGWVHHDSIVLAGGSKLPIKQNSKGEIYIPSQDQQKAGLQPMEAHVAKDGTLSQGRIYSLDGAGSDRERRLALFLLLLLDNPSIRE